jgi:hypothetical protein
MFLSKSDFKIAQSCPTKLYYKKCGYPSQKEDDAYLELLAQGGFMIEAIAKLLYPEGRAVGFQFEPGNAAEATLHALDTSEVTLFEGALISKGKSCRFDILKKRGNEIELIEVKSTAYDSDANEAAVAEGRLNLFRTNRTQSIVAAWREDLEDVTFQFLVLRELFPNAHVQAFIIMPDKAKTTQIDGLYSLFRLRRQRMPDSSFERVEVEFTGDVEELRREHFLTRVPVTSEVELLVDEVAQKASEYSETVWPYPKKVTPSLTATCRDCEYQALEPRQPNGFAECWGSLARVRPHLLDLYHVGTVGGRGGPVVKRLFRQGKARLYDVPVESLVRADGKVGPTNTRRLIQLKHTLDDTEWISGDLPQILRSFRFPLHFIDFETTAMAVPYHAGMRPYEPVAFQWSCHTLETSNATLRHAYWINTEDVFPNFEFAGTLMRQLGREGTVFMWATHENTILRRILEQMRFRDHSNPSLAQWLRWIIRDRGQISGRLVDMNQMCLKHYFHPLMKGRTSVKVVCDSIWRSSPTLWDEYPEYFKTDCGQIQSPYASLPPLEINGSSVVVAEGTGAIRAYEAMMYGFERHDPEIRTRWRDLLRQYCRLDTLAMVWIWLHWNKTHSTK